MSLIREYKPEDLAELVRMHEEMGMHYPFPDLKDPIFFAKLVLESDGKVEQAIVLRGTCEAYMFLDHSEGSAPERWVKFRELHRAIETDALAKGIDDVHCWVPPELVKRFQKRLEALGWCRDDEYTPFCKRLVPAPVRS